MIKIAVVGTRGFPNVQGGVETHCEQLYTHLSSKGCAVTVYTRTPYVNADLREYKGVSLIPLSCPKSKFFETIIHTVKGVWNARKLKPDILHLHAAGPSLFAPLARILGMRVVVTNHGPEYKREKWSWPAKLFLRFCEWVGIKFADAVITIADNIAEDIRRKYGRDAVVIPNGVTIPSDAETEDILGKYALEKHKYILAVGRFVPEKGFHDIMEAFTQIGFEQWKLVIVGDADHEDNYSRSLKSKAMKHNDIVLTGFLSGQPLHELYSYAGLFVLASYYEGLPIVLLEAMSYGLSCLASSIPANRSIGLREERIFEAGNINMLSERMKEFIINPWEDGEKEKMLALIETKYDWANIADDTVKVYQDQLYSNGKNNNR